MASTVRRQEPSIAEQLYAAGYRFDFYQAVRLLELLLPDCTPLGEDSEPSAEAVRLRSSLSLGFPASDVVEVMPPTQPGEPPSLTVSFMALAGGHGPLPHAFTEQILARLAVRDTATRDFLDLFHHRLLSIAFRIHRAHRLGMEIGPVEDQHFARHLYALIGLGTAGMQGRIGIGDRALLRYSGLLNRPVRDLAGLLQILRDHFRVEAQAEPFIGAFRSLDPDQCTSLGASGQNRSLGVDTILGSRVWDQHAGIKLCIGPLSAERYADFLPGRPGCVALSALCRFYLGPSLEVEVSALVIGATFSSPALSSRGAGPALGFTSWLGGRKSGTAPVEIGLFSLSTQKQAVGHG